MVRTIVTRESEWDDLERAKMQGLSIYESQICECGLHESIAKTDPDMEIALPVCPVCAGISQQMRVLGSKDEQAMKAHGENPGPAIPRPSDGRSVRIYPKPPPDES